MLIDLDDNLILAFNTLFQAGVFSVRNGSAEIHFDNEGIIRTIDIHTKVYRRTSVDKPTLLVKL